MSRRITALNSTGIKHIRDGRCHEAILCFRHAIECTRACVDSATENGHVTATAATTTAATATATPMMSASARDRHRLLPIQSICVEHLDNKIIAESSPHNTFDVYQRAFFFPKVDCLVTFQMEISIVLFYNLALAHHLIGLSSVHHAASNFREAQRFYRLALHLFSSSSAPNCSSSSKSNNNNNDKSFEEDELKYDVSGYSLFMGLLTNMGFLYSDAWRAKEALSCHQHLQEVLQSPIVVQVLSEEDLEFFFPNVVAAVYEQRLPNGASSHNSGSAIARRGSGGLLAPAA